MEKYDDLVCCRGQTSQALSVKMPKYLVVIFSPYKLSLQPMNIALG